MARLNKPHAVKLFETSHGPVRAVVIGPKIGLQWRRIKYWRYRPSRVEPGRFDELTENWRANDNRQLAKCVADVQRFLDSENS